MNIIDIVTINRSETLWAYGYIRRKAQEIIQVSSRAYLNENIDAIVLDKFRQYVLSYKVFTFSWITTLFITN